MLSIMTAFAYQVWLDSDRTHFIFFDVLASSNCNGVIDRVPSKVQFSSPTTATATSVADCINKCLSNKPCLAVSYFPSVSFFLSPVRTPMRNQLSHFLGLLFRPVQIHAILESLHSLSRGKQVMDPEQRQDHPPLQTQKTFDRIFQSDKDNCLLSQQSRQTDPTNFLDEKTANVDYYGLDACSSRGKIIELITMLHATLNFSAVAKSKLVRQHGETAKKPLKAPFVKKQVDDPSITTALPNAKEYRQMVIAAQQNKNTHKTKA